jgi:IS5 family transposase
MGGVMADQRGFFDLDERYAALSKAGDPLERLSEVVDFGIFRVELEAALQRSDGTKGGRPPFDAVLMFKVLVLQALYGLSDAQAEFQIMDRRTFGRFLGLDDGDKVPDETTIWRFREALAEAGAVERLFARFDGQLKKSGYLAMGGQIIDASIVAAPRQRMTEEERATVKGGCIPEDWQAKPRKLAQKDRDARWTLKRGRKKRRPDGTMMAEIAMPVFGYKSHIGTDRRHGFIRKWSVSDAARHDGRELAGLLDRTNTASGVWADTAYRSKKNEKRIARAGLVSKIHFRRFPGKDLPANRQRANAARSKVRAHVEHPFAEMKDRMGLFIRTIGITRAKVKIGMANIAFNMKRLVFWERRNAAA